MEEFEWASITKAPHLKSAEAQVQTLGDTERHEALGCRHLAKRRRSLQTLKIWS